MSDVREIGDHKLGQYVLDSMDADELANSCRRLGITGPLEPLLRDLKTKSDKYIAGASPTSLCREKGSDKGNGETTVLMASNRECSVKTEKLFGMSGDGVVGYGQNSYGKQSKDSGIRDLSPEPNVHTQPMELIHSQIIESEPGGTSAMLQLASKVSLI